MRVPLSWLRDVVDIPDDPQLVADKLTAAGFEVEQVELTGAGLDPLVVGVVREIEELTEFKKPIRYCQVDVGEAAPRGIVCGARNFVAGDHVVVALPGAVLPGDFAISARKTYGHVSDGMICSARELAISEDHAGIMVLDQSIPAGTNAVELLGLRDAILDFDVTADRGYALSIRGIARELAIAFGVPFADPVNAVQVASVADGPAAFPARIDAHEVCDHFVLHSVSGIDPAATTPLWMTRRLIACGVRPVSLAVDVTNYVLLEFGQPLHAFDRARLTERVTVRRARAGERLETIDHVDRKLDPDDLLITDDAGPLSLAGTMGGAGTEVSESTTDVVIEAAHFDPGVVARMSRRHKLSSESSRRFERGVDPAMQRAAAARAVGLLVELAGARAGAVTEVGTVAPSTPIELAAGYPSRVAGIEYPPSLVEKHLSAIGCQVAKRGDSFSVTAPSWRPDLTDPADLAEEVLRIDGYEKIPSVLPHKATDGLGLSLVQRRRRGVLRSLVDSGFVEVRSYPFLGAEIWDTLGLPDDDPRRTMVEITNPLSASEPYLRTSLLPGLLGALGRNVSRGNADLALIELGTVFIPSPTPGTQALPVDRRPTDEELRQLDAGLPTERTCLAIAMTGEAEPASWVGPGRQADWADVLEAISSAAESLGMHATFANAVSAPWHPGRCAEVRIDGIEVGWGGQLHPRVTEALGLPGVVLAAEIVLDDVQARPLDTFGSYPKLSTYPMASVDVSLVVAEETPSSLVEDTLRRGAGDHLEDVHLFDVFRSDKLGSGLKSLAYRLDFRAPDRTLTSEEVNAARDSAVALAAEVVHAELRS